MKSHISGYFIILILFASLQDLNCQNVVEVAQPPVPVKLNQLFDTLMANKKSGFEWAINKLENELSVDTTDYEKYKIILNLCTLYTKTKQYDKCIAMWNTANEQGLYFPFLMNEGPSPPYLAKYKGNKSFEDFLTKNNKLIAKVSENAQAEYFVKLPKDQLPNYKYPLIIILHDGIGDFRDTYEYWKSFVIDDHYIAVYPRGRDVKGSFARSYGDSGIADITEIYHQVVQKYPVDTNHVVIAGQSAGGYLATVLACKSIKPEGLLLAFPVKPVDFDYGKAMLLKKRNIKVTMICGEKDERFYPGQKEMNSIS